MWNGNLYILLAAALTFYGSSCHLQHRDGVAHGTVERDLQQLNRRNGVSVVQWRADWRVAVVGLGSFSLLARTHILFSMYPDANDDAKNGIPAKAWATSGAEQLKAETGPAAVAWHQNGAIARLSSFCMRR
jgi:hypothetical protein